MAQTSFFRTTLIFQDGSEMYEVSTDTDYVYIHNEKLGGEIIKIDIQDWFEMVTYIEKQLK